MKLAYKNHKTNKWKTVTKVRTVSVCEEVIILKMMDNSIKTLRREDIRYMRMTKLYEGIGPYYD